MFPPSAAATEEGGGEKEVRGRGVTFLSSNPCVSRLQPFFGGGEEQRVLRKLVHFQCILEDWGISETDFGQFHGV